MAGSLYAEHFWKNPAGVEKRLAFSKNVKNFTNMPSTPYYYYLKC
jgi:hypothetical protein